MAIRRRYYLRISYKVLGFDLCDSRGYLTEQDAANASSQLWREYTKKGAHYVRVEILSPGGTLLRMFEWEK